MDFKQKKVMVLGGGYYQLPLIQTSVRLGYYTIVCGIPGDYIGYKYADKWYDIDTFDKHGCLEIAQNEKIDGICICGTDSVLPTLGFIVDKMGLKGSSYNSSLLASNKNLMKNAFIQNGVRTAKFQKIETISEAECFIANNGFPSVLKVVDGSGSKGVVIVENKNALYRSFENLMALTDKGYLIIEEFIDGEEFGAQAFVKDGELTFVFPHGDMVYQGDTGIPVGHYAPYKLGEELIDEIQNQLINCVKALEINNAAINADFILSNNEIYVLEIGARAGATCLPELVSVYYGIDYYEYLLKNCIGEDFHFAINSRTPCVVETLISQETGVIKSIDLPTVNSDIIDFVLYPKVGDNVSIFRNAYDRIGHIVAKSKELSDAFKIVETLKKELKIELLK